jgi:hypothetical protein
LFEGVCTSFVKSANQLQQENKARQDAAAAAEAKLAEEAQATLHADELAKELARLSFLRDQRMREEEEAQAVQARQFAELLEAMRIANEAAREIETQEAARQAWNKCAWLKRPGKLRRFVSKKNKPDMRTRRPPR